MVTPIPDPPAGVDADSWATAVESIRAWCGWHIAPVITEQITVDGPGGREAGLPTLRLLELISIKNRGVDIPDPEWSANGMVRWGWSVEYRAITAEIRHGFDELPAAVYQVAKGLARRVSMEVGPSARSTAGPFTEQWALGPDGLPVGPTLTDWEGRLLSPYRIPVAP